MMTLMTSYRDVKFFFFSVFRWFFVDYLFAIFLSLSFHFISFHFVSIPFDPFSCSPHPSPLFFLTCGANCRHVIKQCEALLYGLRCAVVKVR